MRLEQIYGIIAKEGFTDLTAWHLKICILLMYLLMS